MPPNDKLTFSFGQAKKEVTTLVKLPVYTHPYRMESSDGLDLELTLTYVDGVLIGVGDNLQLNLPSRQAFNIFAYAQAEKVTEALFPETPAK